MRAGLRRTLLLTATAITIWSFGYGPLLPWSPIRPGFAAITDGRVTVVYPEMERLPAPLRAPAALLREAEQFHRLSASRNITVFVCPDWPTAYRVLPRLARHGVGGITLVTGAAIYVLPTVAERRLDPVEFVRHELSHALLYQNRGLLDASRIEEVEWLTEGIAVWFGDQKAYITGNEFLRLVPTLDLGAYIDPALRPRLNGDFDMRVAYVCWRRFNMFLHAGNPDRYWAYVHAAIRDPRPWRALFESHFGQPFATAISDFARQVQAESAALPVSPGAPGSQSPLSPQR